MSVADTLSYMQANAALVKAHNGAAFAEVQNSSTAWKSIGRDSKDFAESYHTLIVGGILYTALR